MNQHEFYLKAKETAEDDIKDHLNTLNKYASLCLHVTEFGFRHGTSFAALVAGTPDVAVTYDVQIREEDINRFREIDGGILMDFRQESTLKCRIDPTDLLFIDTLHTYKQLKEELKLHAGSVKKYIIFHDVETFGFMGEDGNEPGLIRAILEFMAEGDWAVAEYTPICNGLLVIQRI